MTVRLSACIIAAFTLRISVKFDTGDFCENLLRSPKFVKKLLKKIRNLIGRQNRFFTVAGDIQ
jgi:hypothetical protein